MSYLPLVIFCFSTAITPGPNNLMIMLSGVTFGFRRSLPHYFGICIGFPSMVFLVGLGMGEIFQYMPILHIIIQYLGATYMLYLAWLLISSATKLEIPEANKKPFTFGKALLFQWVNPKAWIMAIGVFATYSQLNINTLTQTFIITLIYLINCVICATIWLVGGISLSKYLTNPCHLRYFNLTMGILLILSIILIFVN
ncbi:MAG: hypothetical protein RLZZ293_439 [Pseudomonadota bacterium]|jgi:threonine/homoserine/homoserine lactone efflux protein